MAGNNTDNRTTYRFAAGFTLIELVVGMLVIGVALVMVATILFPQADRAALTLHRVRSAELAHSVLNEIWGKRFDEFTNANGGVPACGSVDVASQPCSVILGAETGEDRDAFDDIDDYSGTLTINSQMLESNDSYLSQYPNYQLTVAVSYVGSGTAAKLIQVDVTTPNGEVITYHAVRSNY